MKNTSKFLAVMLAITGLFCCAVAVGIGAGFNAVRESTDKKIIAVAVPVVPSVVSMLRRVRSWHDA